MKNVGWIKNGTSKLWMKHPTWMKKIENPKK
jgi:hypothetical protein